LQPFCRAIGLSPEWHRRRRRALWAGWIIGLLGLGTLIGSIVALTGSNNINTPWLALSGLLFGIIAILVGIVCGSSGSQMVRPVRITDDYVWLKGVHPDFLADLPPWPYRP
jgi:hypothetical protein